MRPQPGALCTRVRHGLVRPRNWIQLTQFAAVGATGYAVNLLAFAICEHTLAIDYRVSALIAWTVSVLNNFWLNRRWTFTRTGAQALTQGARFFVVSALTFGLTYVILVTLVTGARLATIPAQAIAIGAATPVNFIGQKLWTFGAERSAPAG